MKLIVALALSSAAAFQATTPSVRPATQLSAYVPSGMTPEEWEKIKAKEKKAKTNLGAGGARGFKSRSFDSFVKALEKGEATHLYAVNPEEVRKGNINSRTCPTCSAAGPGTTRTSRARRAG